MRSMDVQKNIWSWRIVIGATHDLEGWLRGSRPRKYKGVSLTTRQGQYELWRAEARTHFVCFAAGKLECPEVGCLSDSRKARHCPYCATSPTLADDEYVSAFGEFLLGSPGWFFACYWTMAFPEKIYFNCG